MFHSLKSRILLLCFAILLTSIGVFYYIINSEVKDHFEYYKTGNEQNSIKLFNICMDFVCLSDTSISSNIEINKKEEKKILNTYNVLLEKFNNQDANAIIIFKKNLDVIYLKSLHRKDGILTKIFTDSDKLKNLQEYIIKIHSIRAGIANYPLPQKYSEEKIFSKNKPIYVNFNHRLGWYICSVPDEKNDLPLNIMKNKILYFSLIFLLIMIIASIIFADTLTGPIYDLIQKMNEVKISGLSSEVSSLATSGPKEIEDLCEIFNIMLISLSEVVREKDEYAHELEHSNDQLVDFNKNLENSINKRTDELLGAYKNLQKLDEMKSEFLSMVSHDLRTPLSSITGFAQIIHRTIKQDVLSNISEGEVLDTINQILGHIDIVISESDRMAKLIENLLDLARMESGKIEISLEPMDIGEVVSWTVSSTYSLFEKKGLKFIDKMPEELPAILGNRERLVQVMVNLFSNAIKFTSQGHIECTAFEKDAYIIVHVTDTGKGIPGTNKNVIFEKFKQLKPSEKARQQGIGLGLAICKQIIEEHDGKIWVEKSEVGQGTTIAISIPLAKIDEIKIG
ncbi:MAG: ATP-binding protein [Verrucomicrobiota bacterium]|nr:ATP-binding protein [Verrucomicrobiota bacterium]